MMSHIIKIDGTMESIAPVNGVTFTVAEIHRHLGGIGGEIVEIEFDWMEEFVVVYYRADSSLPAKFNAPASTTFGGDLYGNVVVIRDEERPEKDAP